MGLSIRPLLCVLVVAFLTACGGGGQGASGSSGSGSGGSSGSGAGGTPVTGSGTYDVDANGIPKFVALDYIDLNKIYRISKFRSGHGHDYWDAFENCRSMKHYYQPLGSVDWATVDIYAPVNGTVDVVTPEWAGYQISIRSQDYPAFSFILFHVNLSSVPNVGDTVTVGQHLGTHVGSQTTSDIAVRVNTPGGNKLVPFVSVMTDALFANYQTRGLATRDDAIITKEARDADPLNCTGETFGTSGTLVNWVVLN
jgi:hypothetical protein